MCWAGGEIEAGTKAGPFLALRTPPDRERGEQETNISTARGGGHFILDPRRRWRSWKRTFSRCSIRLFPRMELGKKSKTGPVVVVVVWFNGGRFRELNS